MAAERDLVVSLELANGRFRDLRVTRAETGDPHSVTIRLPRGCNNKVTLPRDLLAEIAARFPVPR